MRPLQWLDPSEALPVHPTSDRHCDWRGVLGDLGDKGQCSGQQLVGRMQGPHQPSYEGLLRVEDPARRSPFDGAGEADHPGQQKARDRLRNYPPASNTNPKRAPSAASRMSMPRVMVTPIPTAAPLTAAITGLRNRAIASVNVPPESGLAAVGLSSGPWSKVAPPA